MQLNTLYNKVYRITIVPVNPEKTQAQFLKWEQQFRKGLLNFLVLAALARERHYGYSLMTALRKTLEADMSEGTIYPLLSRLERDGLIRSEWEIQPTGPARKYYRITPDGRELHQQMREHWRHVDARIRAEDKSS